tara:strand:+ start:1432 stop:1773 length:342 start_codon:yes stop_codon:yes gene_type:complete
MLFKILGVSSALLLACSSTAAATSSMLTSWYGPGFHGRLTANGEVFNEMGYTAAHKSLPFGTTLEVCYRSCVRVRINDRGPFISGRELDLSRGAAEAIGLTEVGVDYVTYSYK